MIVREELASLEIVMAKEDYLDLEIKQVAC